ncbi:hypothetical protein ENSA5_22600 [Enhygromyxa salina]|uniref:Uncharacterized protein n=1 Tax=Enhygromyxa salina TaxID=215803 RepID=A0A2S9YBL0_9BACT|nr:hypothetical protein [Enhygromyxa salina]PRQ02442.1 hypothetical protein ENSA5_22600 [Enhygromyxa salina]
MVSKANREFIAELKAQDPFTGTLVPIGDTGDFAKVRFVMRGEWAFYQEGGRATLLEAFAGRGVINRRSIKRWDNGKKITDEEREGIIERVSVALRQAGNEEIRVL